MAALGLNVKGLLDAKKGTRIWISVKGSKCQEFFRPVLPILSHKNDACTMMPLGQGYNQPLSTKKAVREQKWEGWREMSSALGQASALLPYLQSLQPQCHTCLDSKAMEINTWWHEHQNACPYFPVTDSQGICSSVTNRAMSR